MKMIQKTLVFSLLLLSILQCTKEQEQTDVCTQLKVTDIKVTYADEKSIALNWSSTSGAQSFNVKVFDGSNLVFEKKISENTIKIEGLRANKSFKVSVTPYCNQDLASSVDKQITVSTNSGCTAPAVKNFKFNIVNGFLRAEWDLIESVAEYEVSLIDKISQKPIPILDPKDLYTMQTIMRTSKCSLKPNTEPLIASANNISIIIPSGIEEAELIIRPICKIDNFRIDGKNVLTQNIKTESAFSSELINIGDRIIDCSTFDSLSKRTSAYSLPWNFGYTTNSLSNKGKVGQILYLQILYNTQGATTDFRVNVPIYAEKKDGKTTFYNNIENCNCCTQTLNKLESAEVFTFEKYGLDTALNLLVYPSGININGRGRSGNVFFLTD
jgi:hypothetical protein